MPNQYTMLSTRTTVNVSTRFSKDRDRYLIEVISYIGERATSKADEINSQFQQGPASSTEYVAIILKFLLSQIY